MPRKCNRHAIFRYSNLDALLVVISIFQFACVFWGLRNFDQISASGRILFGIILTFLTLTQYHVVMHNFIHTRFFSSEILNSLFAMLCTITTWNIFSEAEIQHFNHHVHANDKIDSVTGATLDPASTYRFGKDGNHEGIFKYSLFSPIREFLETPAYNGRRIRAKRRVFFETFALWSFWAALSVLNWRFVVFYLCIAYVSQVLSAAQNYLEHYGAEPGNRKTDSVSCYGKLYNLIWFNNGYHQEHHVRPAVHWTKLKQLRLEMLPENDRHTVATAHFFNVPLRGSHIANRKPDGLGHSAGRDLNHLRLFRRRDKRLNETSNL